VRVHRGRRRGGRRGHVRQIEGHLELRSGTCSGESHSSTGGDERKLGSAAGERRGSKAAVGMAVLLATVGGETVIWRRRIRIRSRNNRRGRVHVEL